MATSGLVLTDFQKAIYRKPAITTWSRLEGRPRAKEFERSLKAEVRDALWMLTRQWQIGEFKGEDTGSAVCAQLVMESSYLNRFAVKNGKAHPLDDSIPLEAKVEKEILPIDLFAKIQIGKFWLKMLSSSGSARSSFYINQYKLEKPGDPDPEKDKWIKVRLKSDGESYQLLKSVEGKIPDGGKLLSAINDGSHEALLSGTPDKSLLVDLADKLKSHFTRVYIQPDNKEEDAWAPARLEHQFACSVKEKDNSQTVLVAGQYHQNRLDWYSFDIDSSSTGLVDENGVAIQEKEAKQNLRSFIPTAVQFGGMPNKRWWAFEDSVTDFGNINANTTDLALLMLAEFALIYSNDWSVIPCEIETGSLNEIKGLVVTDVFGELTFIRAAGRGLDNDWQRWNMFNLSKTGEDRLADNRIFIPASVSKTLEGNPLEQVNFLRDEMANMVWAVENKIPSNKGTGINGFESYLSYLEQLKMYELLPSPIPPIETEADIKYILGTTVPDNWIPFIPVQQEGSTRSIRLQRAAMPDSKSPDPNATVKPVGVILNYNTDYLNNKYFVFEEEVSRAGAIVNRFFQRTRWYNGKVVTWIGKQKETGRGEGASGLEFDQIEVKG